MDLITYINSYDNCAINHVPTEVLLEWRKLYPGLGLPKPFTDKEPDRHVRFLHGRYISYYGQPYQVGDIFAGGEVQCVIHYEELTAEQIEEVELSSDFADLI